MHTDSTAGDIAKEEGCSVRYVMYCKEMTEKINEACACGLGFLRDPPQQEDEAA